jgi:hypothetical protein
MVQIWLPLAPDVNGKKWPFLVYKSCPYYLPVVAEELVLILLPLAPGENS